jgi:hypothetical protein
VTIQTRPLWKLRLGQRLPRWLLGAVAAAGLLASARYAIAPPHPTIAVQAQRSTPDLAAEGFASLFAREYLSWDGGDLEVRRRLLEPFLGEGLALEAGMQLPAGGSQRVLWDEVVQEREPRPALHVYTVAAETEPGGGLVYLAVSVLHRHGGPLRLASYPAFVGAPATGAARPVALEGSEIEDRGLETVVSRALRNYLAPAPSELAADLVPGAVIATPHLRLSLERVESLVWASADVVVAVVEARNAHTSQEGPRYTLAYEVEVQRVSGRWEVAAIEASAASEDR